MKPKNKLGHEEEGVSIGKGRYQRLVGRLIYLSHTQSDIGFTVSVYEPSNEGAHRSCVKNSQVSKDTPRRGLLFKKNKYRDIVVYSNAN